MSVIVKGMEMPSDCCECRLMDYDLYTGKTWCFPADAILAEDYNPIGFDGRPDWCPLAEVKEPHGDLIDRDELNKCVLKWLPPDPCGREELEYPFETDICVSLLQEIERQPTIIEAEGAEE